MRSEQSLVRWATPQLHDIDALAKMVDPSLNGMYAAKSLSRFADIIALCVQVKSLSILKLNDIERAHTCTHVIGQVKTNIQLLEQCLQSLPSQE